MIKSSANFFNTFFSKFLPIVLINLSFCKTSLEILSEKSGESTIPFTKFKYSGKIFSAFFIINTCFEYKSIPVFSFDCIKLNGGFEGINNIALYETIPSTLVWIWLIGSENSWNLLL